MSTTTPHLDLAPEVAQALTAHAPIVALESTILSHGMPRPDNLAFAHEVEALIRQEGAVPVTIAVIDGRIKVGLTEEQLETMCRADNIQKLSRRDLPIALATGVTGATTVATTMIAAALAGIPVFATGGIGGVHRGAPETFDISADLQELAHTPVAVVCAGAKSILDIGLTLEYLETMGVPVLGYQTGHFPAFYSRESGFGVDAKVDSPQALAEILATKWELGLGGGVLVANPVPEPYALSLSDMEAVIKKALAAAEEANVKGKALTPFLLDYIKTATKGVSLATNVQLALNNARLAAKLAVALKARPTGKRERSL